MEKEFYRWHAPGEKMADTHPVRLESLKIGDMLGDPHLAIPEYQRIYCWDTGDITRFWESIGDLDDIHLGTIILYENGEEKEIVDGQQRLVTLSLMLRQLSEKLPPDLRVPSLALLQRKTGNKEEIQNIANAKWVINDLFSKLDEEEKAKERDKILAIQVTRISIAQGHPDLAYVFFNNQNSKGEKLTDFDLLKAHHLRFITDGKEAEKVAKGWVRMHAKLAKFRYEKLAFHHALGFLVYRLRKLVRRRDYSESEHHVRDEFRSTPWPPAGLHSLDDEQKGRKRRLKTRGKKGKQRSADVMYHAPIKGGTDFFDFAQYFFEKFKVFDTTDVAAKLAYFAIRHPYFYDMAECLLFAYFLKFGKERLAEALFCICAVLGHYRYAMARATKASVRLTRESDLIYLIDQSPSSAFFLAQMLPLLEMIPPAVSQDMAASSRPDAALSLEGVREAWKSRKKTIKTDYYATLCKICDQLEGEFSTEIIKKARKKLYPSKR